MNYPEPVRADILQRFTARERMQARLNIRAAAMPAPLTAWLHGLDLAIGGGSSSLSPLPEGFDDGGEVLITQTPLGNWSSDGADTAPITGMWLYLERTATTETLPGETDAADEDYPTSDVTIITWQITLWEDGTQDATFLWESESLDITLAEDIFAFRRWAPVPDLEDTALEDDIVATDSTVWLEPIEPPPAISPALAAILATKLEISAALPISDTGMLALGFTDQLEISAAGLTWFIPVSSSPWS